MYRPYSWLLALLFLHTVLAQRSFFIDKSCPANVRSVIYEAVNNLLMKASEMRNDSRLLDLLGFIYPRMTSYEKAVLFSIFPLHKNTLYIVFS